MELKNLCMGCMEYKGSVLECPKCGWKESGLPESTLHLPPRTILAGKYILGRVLGQGGFGITYLAWDINLKTKLAIKEYLPQSIVTRVPGDRDVITYKESLSDQFDYGLEKFLQEARTLARFIDHHHIVSVRDFFRESNTAYLVMNYLEGKTLKEHLEQNSAPLSYSQIHQLFSPLLDALEDIHRAGILHRDISPDNIYLRRDGKLVLIDFGAARQAIDHKGSGISVIVKPGFTPEEQCRREGKQGPWTDIYALAASMYWVMTGQKPPESLDRLASDTLISPSDQGVVIPADAEKALLKALSVKSANRYKTAGDFKAALFNSEKPEGKPEYEERVSYPFSINAGNSHYSKGDNSYIASEEDQITDTADWHSPDIDGNNANGMKVSSNNKIPYVIGGLAVAAVLFLVVMVAFQNQEQPEIAAEPQSSTVAEVEVEEGEEASVVTGTGQQSIVPSGDAGPINPTEWSVPGDFERIQQAIQSANSGDTIIVEAGTYLENIDFMGKGIKLTSIDPGDPDVIGSTIIDGGRNGSVVSFNNGENNNAVITGFTITGGSGTNIHYKDIISHDGERLDFNRNYGGGIIVSNGSSPQIINNYIHGNRVIESPRRVLGVGGGIAVLDGSSPTIESNLIVNNTAEGFGGGITVWNRSNPVIRSNIIKDNKSNDYAGGIAVTMLCDPRIEDNELISNSAKRGGALYIGHMSKVKLINNLIQENKAELGAGAYIWRTESVEVRQNKIIGNQASINGAGIFAGNESAGYLESNQFENNIARRKGGAIWLEADSFLGQDFREINSYSNNKPDNIHID